MDDLNSSHFIPTIPSGQTKLYGFGVKSLILTNQPQSPFQEFPPVYTLTHFRSKRFWVAPEGTQLKNMSETNKVRIKQFMFRNLYPGVFLGTASDRYAGWLGQAYSKERYQGRVSGRSHIVGGKSFKEEVLPVENVVEYFEHFPVLELDFTFYRPLLDNDLAPTQNYHVLRTYGRYLKGADRVILKVPQVVFARKLQTKGRFTKNPDYLNVQLFIRQFYEPAVDLLGDSLTGFIFEQEYQAKRDKPDVKTFREELDAFFGKIPQDARYHVEVRTPSLLSPPYFNLLEKHGVGQVLSHWTWLPPLSKQFELGERRFFNRGMGCVVRLLTPLRVRYDESYATAFPFDRLVDGMMSRGMVDDVVHVIHAAIDQGVDINVLINNRAGGNAPLIAQHIARRLQETAAEDRSTAP
jgi:uncharacterized protein YecE (DUF72 family)